MNAAALREGDLFVESTDEAWLELTPHERSKRTAFTAKSDPMPCPTAFDRVHFRCSGGNWCIPITAPVVLV